MSQPTPDAAPLSLHEGVAHWAGRPAFLITAEYPYFRDDPANWQPRLQQMVELGVRVLSTYIPWRHHVLPGGGFDFTGATQANRDVLGFLRLCQGAGLWVLVKPGPFCHAELNYGGLPDHVCPLFRPDIAPALAAGGQPITWGGSRPAADGTPEPWPLPSAFCPAFQREVRCWFTAVRRQVLGPNCAPAGAIVAVQVGNEGIFCDGHHAVWAQDRSVPALAAYRRWLRRRYRSIAAYNRRHGTAVADWDAITPPERYTDPGDPRGLACYSDWSAFVGHALGRLYGEFARWLRVPVPALANVNPPTGDSWGVDAWLSRVEPATWGPVHYGYTNWIGIAAEDPSAMARYMVLTRRAPGPNVEENWGFTQYGPAYSNPSVCFQQTLVAIAGGATGYNLYTAVGTAHWDEALDRFQPRPYPADAPIGPDGRTGAKAAIAAKLGAFFQRHGADYVACRPVVAAAWGVYLPHSRLGAWTAGLPAGSAVAAGHALPAPGPALLACQQVLTRLGADLDLADLERTPAEALARYPLLLVSGGPCMAEAVQQRLAAYAAAGGCLLLIGPVPHLDEHLRPCRLIAAAPHTAVPDAAAAVALLPDLLARSGGPRLELAPADAFAWVRAHPERDVHFVLCLSRAGERLRLRYRLHGRAHALDLTLAPAGGAVIRVTAGRPEAVLIRGLCEHLGRAVVPSCSLNGEGVSADHPCDLLAERDGGRWRLC